jgi:ABC-type Fe3+-siderophore transport system permease subunit
MSIHSRVTKWRNVGRFCAERAADYSELLALELEQTKKRLIRELGALVAMAVAALFALAFVCIAIIATARQTSYFLLVVWGVAAGWLVLALLSFLVVRAQKPARSLHVLHAEVLSDLNTLKEALK